MFHSTCSSYLLLITSLLTANCHFIPDYSHSHYDEKLLEKLYHGHQDSHGNDNFCHGSHGKNEDKILEDMMKNNALDGGKSNQDYSLEYSDEEDLRNNLARSDEVRQRWPKRSQSVSPFISLGALSNLPQFFEQLKGSMDRLEEQQTQQQSQLQAASMAAAAAAAAEAERSFRPPSTAAVLHAFRNYRPLRRTRSYPPALIHG